MRQDSWSRSSGGARRELASAAWTAAGGTVSCVRRPIAWSGQTDRCCSFVSTLPGDAGVTALEGISGEADSGGPAYIELEGVLFTIGVSSHQDARPAGRKRGTYGVLEYYSRVSYFADWIREVLAPESASESAPSIPAN